MAEQPKPDEFEAESVRLEKVEKLFKILANRRREGTEQSGLDEWTEKALRPHNPLSNFRIP